MTEYGRSRGLLDGDDKAFSPGMREKLAAAQRELQFLLNRGYPMKSAATFVGNHHQLSARQLLALTRATCPAGALARRLGKRLEARDMAGQPIRIDGFNLIITLEVALSDGVLLMAQDGSIRDLAELRGTYRIIPQTGQAIAMLREALAGLKTSRAAILLDAPVSNSGKLKTAFFAQKWPMPLSVDLTPNPDAELKQLGHVASGDSVILDQCLSWFNLAAWILETQGWLPRLTRFVRLDRSWVEAD